MNLEENFEIKNLLSYPLNRVSLLYKRRLYAEFQSACIDLRPEQWQLLVLLHDNPGMIQSELAIGTDKDPTNITRSIDCLGRYGLLERKADQDDRRCYHVYLTERGMEAVNRLIPTARAVNLAMQEGLTEEDRLHLKRSLDIIRRNLGDLLDGTNIITTEKEV